MFNDWLLPCRSFSSLAGDTQCLCVNGSRKIFSQKAGIKFVNTKTSRSNDGEEKLRPISVKYGTETVRIHKGRRLHNHSFNQIYKAVHICTYSCLIYTPIP